MSWLVIFFLVLAAAIVFIFSLSHLAEPLKLIDRPDARKRHGSAVPTVGGIAIYLVILCAVVIFPVPLKLSWLIFAAGILVIFGALDDAFGLGVRVRFASQLIATGLMIFGSESWIRSIGIPLGGLAWVLHWLGVPLTIFAVVGLTNGFNMADGIDGLAAGHMLVGLACVLLTLDVTQGTVHQLEWLIILASAVFAFWLVNLSFTPLKRVFLGDAGSLMLGFVMAWILIYYTQDPISMLNPVAALWCVTIPVFDALIVIARRLRNGLSPFSSDRNHLHHLLIDIGFQPKLVLMLILGLAAVVNIFGILLTYLAGPIVSLIAYGVFLFIFGQIVLSSSLVRVVLIRLKSRQKV